MKAEGWHQSKNAASVQLWRLPRKKAPACTCGRKQRRLFPADGIIIMKPIDAYYHPNENLRGTLESWLFSESTISIQEPTLDQMLDKV